MTDTETAEPLHIVMVVDSIGNRGNGTSNSALQYAEELRAQGHNVRLVGIGAPVYRARIHRIPFVSFIAAKQQMSFAQPSEELFDQAFDGADVVHIYLPFKFGCAAMRAAKERGIAVTAGFHTQPENITYSAGLRHIPGAASFLYALFRHHLYKHVDHIHVPTQMGADLLRRHHYHNSLHVISNGYEPRFSPHPQPTSLSAVRGEETATGTGESFRILASGRLANEKDHMTLLKAVALSAHSEQIEVHIAGTGPLRRKLRRFARRKLSNLVSIGFHPNVSMPDFLRSGDLFVHPSIADLESVSVLEALATGLVPVIADSPLSAAGQFSLCEQSSFPVEDAAALAERIDWWIEHPQERAEWSHKYAEHAAENYSISACVRKFVQMEREAIADNDAE